MAGDADNDDENKPVFSSSASASPAIIEPADQYIERMMCGEVRVASEFRGIRDN
jgi:hypothetical protein